MKQSLQTAAKYVGTGAFFIALFLGVNWEDLFNVTILISSLVKACAVGAVCWFFVFIVGDIIAKALIEHIEPTEEDVLDDGLLQRIHEERDKKSVTAG